MPTKKDESKKSRLSSVTTSSHVSPESPAAVSSLLRCVPRQKPLVYGHGLLRVAEALHRPSLQPECPDSTRGLGPCHPTIRDWNDRRAIKSTYPYLVTQPTGSLKSRYVQDNRLDGCVRSNQLVAAVLGGRSGVSFSVIDKEVSDSSVFNRQATLQESAPTEAAGITALDTRRHTRAQKRTVRFADEDARNKSATVSCVTTAGRSANTSDRASRHSRTLTYPPTPSAERSIDSIFSSATSLASLTDCHSGSLTSLPSLPLLQSKGYSTISSGSSSSFIIQSHLSERDVIYPMTGVASVTGRKEPHCSVINLRIPFGKVEEWDVPQKKLPIPTNTVGTGESQQSKNPESASGLTHNQATLRKIDFVVFSDLPKQPISSTSSLMATVMQSHHPSPHAAAHWTATNPGFSQNHINYSRENITLPNPAGATDSIRKLSDTKDSSNPTKTPELTPATVELSQCLPHTLRYRHLLPTQRRSPLPARLVELSSASDRDPNPSMYIRSYPGSNHWDRNEHASHGTHSLDGANRASPPSTRVVYGCTGDGYTRSSCTSLSNSPRTQKNRLSTIGGRADGDSISRKPWGMRRKTSDKNGFGYPDPLEDCSSRYRHRLLKMAALVSQTLSNEHSRRRHKRQHSH